VPSLRRRDPVARAARHPLVLRLLAAALLAPPVLLAVVLGPPWSDLLLLLLALGMAWEWGRLCGAGRPFGLPEAALTLAAPTVLLLGMLGGAAVALGGFLLALLLLVLAARGAARPDVPLPWLLLGLAYVTLPLLLLRWLRGDDAEGRLLVLWLLLVVWATDTGAYAAGKAIGGPKLAPRLSPRKTWAGLAGGVVAAAATAAMLASWTGLGPALPLALLGALLALVGQAGDLLESGIKRHFGVKDSSGLIPGHGGLLDRVDALVAATLPLAALAMLGVFAS